ncbi:hypothetical protein NA57DRAFT_76127 [Rhizodiscina lignyota]|uniref:Uncharacterized protein n=1 Tax=Rhizodiscina lignyota TaxID=1504668 RepID=A0A9P4M662_9PEZI|nr:hypothetical protein NA57DRAFT_76127 [Rhizodiscina lignyota]
MDHIIHAGVKGITKSIAVTSEAIAGRKKNGSDSSNGHANGTERHHDEDLNRTELEWELDEIAAEQDPPSYEAALNGGPVTATTAEQVSQRSLNTHQNATAPPKYTPCPITQVILLPQRRPKDRNRGFVRAYPPILGEVNGIYQDMFLDFITEFDKALQASPKFDVINIASFGVGHVPTAICLLANPREGTANGGAVQDVQVHYRSNEYLDRINDTLFKPRGLFAMVTTYKPELADDLILQANTTKPTVSITKPPEDQSRTRQTLKRLRHSFGEAGSDVQLPEFAPLVYPSLDHALTSQALPQNTIQRNYAAVNDYLDRRAQVDFVMSNRDLEFAKALPPQKKFVNRFCDPNHPVNSGSLFGLITGGTFDPIAMGRVRRAESKAKRNGEAPLTEQEKHDAYMGRQVRGRVTGTPSKKVPILSKMLKHDVLYLIIVNMPTEAEMEEVRQALRSAQTG